MDKIVFVIATCESSHQEVGAIRHLELDLFPFLFLNQVSRGDVRNRRSHTQLPFLALGGFQAFRRGLEAGAHGKRP